MLRSKYPAHLASSAPVAGRIRAAGLSLLELLVALVLFGILASAVYGVLARSHRLYRQQAERSALYANSRAAAAFLPPELLELNAADTVQSDLVSPGESTITYRAMRNVAFVCQPPVSGGSSGAVTVWADRWYGLRALDPDRDSVLVFAEGSADTGDDDHWVHANLTGVAEGTACPTGASSLTLTLESVYPLGSLAAVRPGAPLRGYEMRQLTAYPDRDGVWWLGLRHQTKATGWAPVQPVLGPLAPGGLRFSYFDSLGAAVGIAAGVSRISIELVGQTTAPVWDRGGALEHRYDTVALSVALRGNPQ